jgi:hypothetical protein
MGTWQLLVEDSQVAAVHAALLPTGEVVYYSGNTGPAIPAQVRLWNPGDGSVRTLPNEPDTDLFCSGHALLPDGRLFVCGGTAHYSTGPDDPWGGSAAAYVLDPVTGWQRVGDMAYGRWYPSVICLPDGRMLVASGTDLGATVQAVEVYHPSSAAAPGWTRTARASPTGPTTMVGTGGASSARTTTRRAAPGRARTTWRCCCPRPGGPGS